MAIANGVVLLRKRRGHAFFLRAAAMALPYAPAPLSIPPPAAGAGTDYSIGLGMGIDPNAIIDALPAIRDDARRQQGVAIWIIVTYKFCEWDSCWWRPWSGSNDWNKTKKEHRCSAEGLGAEYKKTGPGSAGFLYKNKAGIAAAIPGCIREAINSIKNR